MNQSPTPAPLLPPCPRCQGKGFIRRRNVDHTTDDVRCPSCKGSGAQTEAAK